MGYFPNGTAGMCYEEQFCWNCVHWNDGGCPVMDAHNLYNYDQHDDNDRGKALKVVLDLLIPGTKNGLGNEQCSMFRATADPEAEWAEQRRLAEQPAKYADALAAATGTARTAKPVECGASQSGHEVATPTPYTLNQGPTHER